MGVFRGGEVLVVVANLKDYANDIDEGDAVSEKVIKVNWSLWSELGSYLGLLLSACISLIANLNNPPVLFPTISK